MIYLYLLIKKYNNIPNRWTGEWIIHDNRDTIFTDDNLHKELDKLGMLGYKVVTSLGDSTIILVKERE